MTKKNRKPMPLLVSCALPLLGMIFLVWYIKAAGADVVYSDYIRIISEYLPDVGDITKLFTPDILTRVPAAFLMRLFNVRNLGYSVTFDRILGLAGMALMAGVLWLYMRRFSIGWIGQVIVYIVLFSLSKWEIMLNGTAWTHLVSFGIFFVNYYLVERLWKGETSPKEDLLILLFPILLLLIAGEYIASYIVGMILVSLLGILMGGGADVKRGIGLYKAILLSSFLAIAIYLLSRHFAVFEHVGMSDMGLFGILSEDPLYIPVFFFKSFAGAVLGLETVQNFFGSGHALPGVIVLFLGIVIFSGYMVAFFCYFRTEIYEITIFPLILLISGFTNHILITVSRWGFLDTSYGMSSRYAAQYMVGIIGMIIIFILYARRLRALRGMTRSVRSFIKTFVIFALVFIVLGNCYTTFQEIEKASYREENYTQMAEAILNHEDYTPEELARILEWTKDPGIAEEACGILEEYHLNVFR